MVFFSPGEVPMDKHGETQGWYIWWPSNKRSHEGPNVWQSTERSITIYLAVIEVSSYKLPGKPHEWEYEKEIEELQKSFCKFGAWMLVKLHFLWSHLDYFPKNWGDLSEEQVEHFHQDICIMEEGYQGWWDVNFLADYSWKWSLQNYFKFRTRLFAFNSEEERKSIATSQEEKRTIQSC